jgi:hypothetical protein
VHNCIYQQTHKTKTKTVAVAGRQTGTSVFLPPSGFVPFVSSLLCCVDNKEQGSNKEGGRRIEDRKRKRAEEEENLVL